MAGQVYLLEYIVLAAYPEEHDRGQQGADGADIDGAHVHPLGDDRGDEQAHSNADGPDDADGSGPWQVEQLLEGGGGGLKQIDQRGQSSETTATKNTTRMTGPPGIPRITWGGR